MLKPKIVIMNSQYDRDDCITLIMPIDAAKVVLDCLQDATYNLTIAEKLEEAIEATERGYAYLDSIEKAGD